MVNTPHFQYEQQLIQIYYLTVFFSNSRSIMKNPYIEYCSLLFEQDVAPKQLQDFANGLLISQILLKIKQFPPLHLQQNPSTFAHIFSNLKEIYKKIQQFWNQNLDKQIQTEEMDLVEIAHHKNPKQIPKILNLVIQTMVLSSQNQFFVGKILQTSQDTQQYFMSIVESTLQKRKTFSPRKQREQRFQDKIIQLNHENQNLQNAIVELCKQKQDVENALKLAQNKITQKQKQIKKLNETLADYSLTPVKKKDDNNYDTHEKNMQFVEKLKQKVKQMTKNHEKQSLSYKQQIQYLTQKSQMINHLQNQLQIYKVKVQANTEAIQQCSELSRKYAEMKLSLIQKQQMANEYFRKMNAKTTKLQQVEQKMVEMELQLQRKNVQIEELTVKRHTYNLDERFEGLNSLSLHRTLSQHCPEVANSQAQFLYQSNKKLREQLERATSTIRQREIQLQKLKKQYEKRQTYETQNKKLLNIIDQMTDQHDEQKSLILGCLHQVRIKTINQIAPRQRAMKHEIKANLRAQNIRVLSRGLTKRNKA